MQQYSFLGRRTHKDCCCVISNADLAFLEGHNFTIFQNRPTKPDLNLILTFSADTFFVHVGSSVLKWQTQTLVRRNTDPMKSIILISSSDSACSSYPEMNFGSLKSLLYLMFFQFEKVKHRVTLVPRMATLVVGSTKFFRHAKDQPKIYHN